LLPVLPFHTTLLCPTPEAHQEKRLHKKKTNMTKVVKQQPRISLTFLLLTAIIAFASATRQQTRLTENFSPETHYKYNIGHRPATSILPVKLLNFHHKIDQAGPGVVRNEFDRLNRANEHRYITRKGIHDAVVYATRQSSDILVMSATSWN
jgi:hypothetical protein